MATETLENKSLVEEVPVIEKTIAEEGDEEKGSLETVEKNVVEEEKVKEVEEEQEAAEEEKKTDEDEEPSEKATASRKRSRRRNSTSKEPATPVDRPSRERKSVERYSALSSEKVPAAKGLSIEKGRGTQLKDIPNVAFKLSKRKPDENLQMLHTILFGKKAKVHILKRNISQFSGYVWLQNEEKQRTKVKEKIDKFIKEKLLDFCDVLDIPVSKATTKKEELSVKLLDFLESPHATTEVSLAEKEEKGKKRKRKASAGTKVTSGKASRHGSNKKQSPETTDKEKHKIEVEEEAEDEDETGSAGTRVDTDESDDSDRVQEESGDEGESESENAKDKRNLQMESIKGSSKKTKGSEAKAKSKTTPVKTGTATKSVKSPAKSIKGSSKSASRKDAAADDDKVSASLAKSKASGIKRGSEDDKKGAKNTGTSMKEKSTSITKPSKSEAKVAVKEKGAVKANKKAKAEPSRGEMHIVVSNIMKEVDFNTATLSDIIRQLGTHFGMDLMHRKAEVKGIIEEIISNMTDEEDEEDDENTEHAGEEADSDV